VPGPPRGKQFPDIARSDTIKKLESQRSRAAQRQQRRPRTTASRIACRSCPVRSSKPARRGTAPDRTGRLDDCFGDFLVRVVCECGACREITPLGRLESDAQGARATDEVLEVREEGCQGPRSSVARPRPRGVVADEVLGGFVYFLILRALLKLNGMDEYLVQFVSKTPDQTYRRSPPNPGEASSR
jgi:hypothetical protein